MSDGTGIEWTDETWNPVRGCTKVSPGCKHCYAETFAERFRGVLFERASLGFWLLSIGNPFDALNESGERRWLANRIDVGAVCLRRVLSNTLITWRCSKWTSGVLPRIHSPTGETRSSLNVAVVHRVPLNAWPSRQCWHHAARKLSRVRYTILLRGPNVPELPLTCTRGRVGARSLWSPSQ